jgi:NAD(P)-dependent dehydrogenase (short-subunit alcohol dehydrogenase family)
MCPGEKEDSDAMPTVLITGANEGLGLQLAIQYATIGWEVMAACSDPLDTRLSDKFGELIIDLRYNALEEGSARNLVDCLDGRAIDVVILNEGISDEDGLLPEAITLAHWRPIMVANTFAPLHLASLLEPNLRKGELKILTAVSSHAASISRFQEPRRFAYRASQSALNQMWRNLSFEWRSWGCICLLLEPGKFRVSNADDQGLPDIDSVAAGFRSFITAANREHSGRHWAYDGTPIPW